MTIVTANAESADVLLEAIHEERRRALGVFIKENHARAVSFARMFVAGNLPDAEEVVSRVYLKMLTGRTPEKYFYLALKRTASDLRSETGRRRMRFPSLDAASVSANDESPRHVSEPPSRHAEDADPADILLKRAEAAEHKRLVRKALRDPRWRHVRRRKWAQALCPAA